MLKFVGVKQPTNLVNDETFDVFRTRVRLPPTPPRRDMIYYDKKGYEDLRDSVMWVMDKFSQLFITLKGAYYGRK